MWFLIFLILNIFRIINLEEIDKFWFLKLKILLMLGIYLVRMFCERFGSKFLKGDRKNKNYNLKVSIKWFWYMIRNRLLVLFLMKGYCYFGNIFWFLERGIYIIFLEESILLFLFFLLFFGSLLLNFLWNILVGYVFNINKVFNFRSWDFLIFFGFVILEVFGVRNIGNYIGFFV